MKAIHQILLLTTLSSPASVVWQPAPNALASVSWDVWSYAPTPGQTGSGSQGSAQDASGSLITSSDLETSVTDSYDFPGGLGGNPDTYYFHTGGGEWTASLQFSEEVTHVRVSYALLDFGGGAATGYPLAPGIAGASLMGEGSYASDDGSLFGTVFYRDLALASPQTSIEATFGDVLFPGYPGSFRSIDGVRLEVFDAAPIPEPSASLLVAFGASLLWRRRK